jgi:hypothetical protein
MVFPGNWFLSDPGYRRLSEQGGPANHDSGSNRREGRESGRHRHPGRDQTGCGSAMTFIFIQT